MVETLLLASYLMASIVLLFHSSVNVTILNLVLSSVFLAFLIIVEIIQTKKEKSDRINSVMLLKTIQIQNKKIADLEEEVLKLKENNDD